MPEMGNQYRPMVPTLQDKVRLSHTFLKIFENEKPQPDFYQSLRSVCLSLPGKFRMYMHDINQITSYYKGDFTFEMAGIDQLEAQRWMTAGIGPVVAGYWRAFDIAPEQATYWVQSGFQDPENVSLWIAYGFTPESGLRWANMSFPPALARRWYDGGYDAENAATLIQQGFEFPDMVP
jgi:hypothetical protein